MSAAVLISALVAAVALRNQARVHWDLYFAHAALDGANPQQALEWLTAAEAAAPDRADVQYWLGVASRRAGRVSEAMPHFDRASELGWPPADLRRQRLLAHFQAGNRREAELDVKRMLDSAPNDEVAVECYEALVKGYLADIRIKEALVCLRFWLEWQPDCIEARILRADAMSIVGDAKTQEQDLKYVLALEPQQLEAGARLGQLLMSKNEIDAALTQFTQCHEYHPGDPQSLLGMAHCEYRLGRFEEAQQHADQGLAIAETDGQRFLALLTLGQLAIEKKDFERAVDLLDKATKLAPNEPTAFYALGIALTETRDRTRRKEAMDQYQRLEKLNSRLSELGEEVTHMPDDPRIRVEAAGLLKELGNRLAAISWLRSAIALAPDNAEAHRALADLYREDGHLELAQQHEALANQYSASAIP